MGYGSGKQHIPRVCLVALLSLGLTLAGSAAGRAATTEQVVVTATRTPEPAAQIPAEIDVISGDELRARDASDLGAAMALVPGVDAPPGGDAGPSSAVPSFWGLHEFDAFLLVVDSVPWGGAFNPAIASLDLNDVERIEVLKGAAPVMYGATSFVGVVHVLHYPAGQASNDAELALGNFDSFKGRAAFALPAAGAYQHSIALSGQKLGFADDRERIEDGRFLYRGSTPFAGGRLGIDASATLTRDSPPSPVIREEKHLALETPHNANYNPADSKIDENRYQLALDYSRATSFGTWETLASFTHSDIVDIRGFLRPELIDDGSANADSARQHRLINDVYMDTHVVSEITHTVTAVVGADFLYGVGRQRSSNGEYFVPLDGRTLPPPTTAIHVDEANLVDDRRWFWGQYAQIDWRPAERWDVIAGLRLNETHERKLSNHVDGFDPADNEAEDNAKDVVRLAGTVGASYRVWNGGPDTAMLYADYRNAFKPAAIDFGFEFEPDILDPETAQSYEGGLRGTLAGGAFNYEIELFLLDFKNLVVPTTNEEGGPELRNAGGERLKGIEVGGRYLVRPDLTLAASASYHEARFTNFATDENGTPLDAGGNDLVLSPHWLASLGLIYAPDEGWNGALVAHYVGPRFLDEANEARTSSYTLVDARLGYRFDRFEIAAEGNNLANSRAPVTQSEFGSGSFYLLPARTWFVSIGARL